MVQALWRMSPLEEMSTSTGTPQSSSALPPSETILILLPSQGTPNASTTDLNITSSGGNSPLRSAHKIPEFPTSSEFVSSFSNSHSPTASAGPQSASPLLPPITNQPADSSSISISLSSTSEETTQLPTTQPPDHLGENAPFSFFDSDSNSPTQALSTQSTGGESDVRVSFQ